jgi:hypothetical protein
MNIIEAFDHLSKTSYDLMRVYWEISDNYRGPSDFDVGLSQFIETIEGQKLEKELSVLTDKAILSIDEILDKITKNEVIEKENVKIAKGIIIDFSNNFISINAKNCWFNEHKMDTNERAKLNGYFENFISKVRLLDKAIKEKKDTLNIITIWEAIDIINKIVDEEFKEFL